MSTFTGSTVGFYTLEFTGSYNGNCPICGHLLYGSQIYGSGSLWYIECGWHGGVFESGSGADANELFRGYMQGANLVKYMVFGHKRNI